MFSNFPIPTLDDVERISKIKDPVVRNLQITQCYHELSAVLASQMGLSANWCTFATWASKQAGQTIRKEDLARLLERRLRQSASVVEASSEVAAAIPIQEAQPSEDQQIVLTSAGTMTSVIDRASDAVSRGNLKVFMEIGYEFSRFYITCISGQQVDPHSIMQFCEELRPGDPPDGQGYLRQAFSNYFQALTETNAKTRAELILLANIQIGFHEQTRLQPEIAESLDAGWMSFLELSRSIFGSVFPFKGWFQLIHLYLRRLLRHPTALDLAIQSFLTEVKIQLRHIITDLMMTISMPSGVVLRLGKDIKGNFPESLKHITNQDLVQFLARHDLTPDSLSNTGALDWADLSDRLHFILDLFRCYQEQQSLFEPPFTPEQVHELKGGRLPGGRL
jgi:hypothetical protein